MWDKVVRNLGLFSSAVLSGADAAGYPFSIRCRPQIDHARQILSVQVPGDVPIQPGPAGLLCHSHDERLWNLKEFLLRGRLERKTDGWVFRPQRFTGGAMGPLDMMKTLLERRRIALQYLEKRGLPRPRIPWEAINALHAEARGERVARGISEWEESHA